MGEGAKRVRTDMRNLCSGRRDARRRARLCALSGAGRRGLQPAEPASAQHRSHRTGCAAMRKRSRGFHRVRLDRLMVDDAALARQGRRNAAASSRLPEPSAPEAGGAGPGGRALAPCPREAERQRFAPWLAVALGAGVLVYFALPSEPPAGARGSRRRCCCSRSWSGWRALRPARRSAWPPPSRSASPWPLWHAGRQPPPLDLPRGAVVVSGRVADVDLLPEGRRVTLDRARASTAARRCRGRSASGCGPRIRRGRSRATCSRVRALVARPGRAGLSRRWDFQRAAFFSGPRRQRLRHRPRHRRARHGRAPPLAGLRAAIEARVHGRPARRGRRDRRGAADRRAERHPAADLAAMRDSGLAHLLSVSGLHIAIVMGVAFAVLRAR